MAGVNGDPSGTLQKLAELTDAAKNGDVEKVKVLLSDPKTGINNPDAQQQVLAAAEMVHAADRLEQGYLNGASPEQMQQELERIGSDLQQSNLPDKMKTDMQQHLNNLGQLNDLTGIMEQILAGDPNTGNVTLGDCPRRYSRDQWSRSAR